MPYKNKPKNVLKRCWQSFKIWYNKGVKKRGNKMKLMVAALVIQVVILTLTIIDYVASRKRKRDK